MWRTLTEPELLARWWAPGDIAATVGHRFHLQIPGWGEVPCEVLDVDPGQRLVYTFTESDLDDTRSRDTFDRMGPSWRDQVLPDLARIAAELPSSATKVC